ncbi:MAG: molybdenum cofactor biosynthesis protein B [Sulfuriflexus sp.]|nr:molybdenum cofactor biosynthesis protein B [Sulfuriflexus sp.]
MTDINPSLKIAVLTVSDTRTEETDKSGKTLVDRLTKAGHQLAEKAILKDDKYLLRAKVANWIAEEVPVVLITGGTGITGRDVTPDAISPLFDKEIPGFGELFRMLSYDEIKTSTIQSRAIAGLSNSTLIFCLPGSTGACRTAWDKILKDQLDVGHGPCNFVEIMPRIKEV